MPVGLKSAQLQKLQQGQRLKVSPQWQMINTPGTYPAKEQTAVGCETNGDALWLSLRLDKNMRLQVGKIRPDLDFSYAETASGMEQWFQQPHYDSTNAWSALYTGASECTRLYMGQNQHEHVHAVL